MRAIAIVALAVAVAVAGCGTADDREQVRDVGERFYDAVRAGDGQGACDQLSAAAVSQLESQSGQRCREVVTRLRFEGGAIVQAEVFMTNAKVDLRNGESAFLGREPTGWKLTAIGCRPEDGKLTHRPYECEAKA